MADGSGRESMDDVARQAAIGAALARCGAALRTAALATGIAAIALGVLVRREPDLPMTVIVLLTIAQTALTAAGVYLGLRTGFDAELFAELIRAPDLTAFDAAMTALNLLPQAKSGRTMAARVAGVKRLLLLQGLALAAQLVLFVGLLGAGVGR